MHSPDTVAATGPWQASTDSDSTLLYHWAATQNHHVQEDGIVHWVFISIRLVGI